MTKKTYYVCAIKIGNKWIIKTILDNPFYLLPTSLVQQADDYNTPISWSQVQDYKILEKL